MVVAGLALVGVRLRLLLEVSPEPRLERPAPRLGLGLMLVMLPTLASEVLAADPAPAASGHVFSAEFRLGLGLERLPCALDPGRREGGPDPQLPGDGELRAAVGVHSLPWWWWGVSGVGGRDGLVCFWLALVLSAVLCLGDTMSGESASCSEKAGVAGKWYWMGLIPPLWTGLIPSPCRAHGTPNVSE